MIALSIKLELKYGINFGAIIDELKANA